MKNQQSVERACMRISDAKSEEMALQIIAALTQAASTTHEVEASYSGLELTAYIDQEELDLMNAELDNGAVAHAVFGIGISLCKHNGRYFVEFWSGPDAQRITKHMQVATEPKEPMLGLDLAEREEIDVGLIKK